MLNYKPVKGDLITNLFNIIKMDNEENTTPKHECSGDDCQHEEHNTAPAADNASENTGSEEAACKACAGEEGAEHTCNM